MHRGLTLHQSASVLPKHELRYLSNRGAKCSISPCMRAIELLENLPAAAAVDDRVQLALDTTRCLGGQEHPELGVRALLASKPPGAEISDPYLHRKWLLFVEALEVGLGHPGSAIRHLAAALELATELQDVIGICNVWNNLSRLAAGVGQFEDAVRYTTLALDSFQSRHPLTSNINLGEFLASAYINRGNALHRLGRLDAAVSDAANGIANSFCNFGPTPLVINVAQRTNGLCLLAELRVERGELVQAQALLESAETINASSNLMESSNLNIRRVRGELLCAEGRFTDGVKLLQRALSDSLGYLPHNASDDHVVDILHALHGAYRAARQPDKADIYLRRIGERLRTNAERALAAFSSEPQFSSGDSLDSALLDVDRYLSGMASKGVIAEVNATSAWQNMVGIAAAASAVEEPSGEHGVRVGCLGGHIARALGLDDASAKTVEDAGLIHDVGKVGIPPSVLTKRESLSEQEAQLLVRHADEGAQLIERSAVPNRARLAELVRLHHQPLNGGVRGSQISSNFPIEARILSASDQFDALVTGRPRMAGRELDPRVVDVLIETVRQLQRGHENLIDFLAGAAVAYDYTAARRIVRRAADSAAR